MEVTKKDGHAASFNLLGEYYSANQMLNLPCVMSPTATRLKLNPFSSKMAKKFHSIMTLVRIPGHCQILELNKSGQFKLHLIKKSSKRAGS